MSARLTDEKLRELVGLFEAMDEGGAPPELLVVLVGETHAALTELLALRAEVERLQAVKQAAKALRDVGYECGCVKCWGNFHGRGQVCLEESLYKALDAITKEPEKL